MYDGPFVYDWDALNRLVRVERDDGVSTLTTIAENAWDTTSRRVDRWCSDGTSDVDSVDQAYDANGTRVVGGKPVKQEICYSKPHFSNRHPDLNRELDKIRD